MPPTTCLVTALSSEARPLIEHYSLSRQTWSGRQLYANENCLLLQTGIGKLNAAAATGALLQAMPDIDSIINIGVAGGKDPKGSIVLATTIVDAGSGKRWYPHLPPVRCLPGALSRAVRTLDEPNMAYQAGSVFDMEAAGIFTAATARMDLSRVHSLKVISDTPGQPFTELNKKEIPGLIKLLIGSLDALMLHLQQSNHGPHASPTEHSTSCLNILFDELIQQCHHTTSDRHTLHRLLQRYQAIAGSLPDSRLVSRAATAASLRRQLQAEICAKPLIY
ncbi:MAG: hypothetical protein V3U76_12615 [Granulosicoccus sp.]